MSRYHLEAENKPHVRLDDYATIDMARTEAERLSRGGGTGVVVRDTSCIPSEVRGVASWGVFRMAARCVACRGLGTVGKAPAAGVDAPKCSTCLGRGWRVRG